MAEKISLEVVTPEKEVFNAMVDSIILPAVAGSTGILYNHAPLLTVLQPGVLIYRDNGQEGRIAVSNGFMELNNNVARVLVSAAENAEDIDTARALASAERARTRLAERQEGLDVVRAEASLHRALARLKAANYTQE